MPIVRSLLAVVCLAALGAAPARGAGRLEVGEDGRLTVAVPGKADVRSHLFLHYGQWVWRSAGPTEPAGKGRRTGAITKRAEDGPGAIAFTRTVRPVRDGLRIRYEFERRGEMDVIRGVSLALSFPYPDYAGRQIVFTHGPPATTDAHFSVAARGCTVNLSEDVALRIDCAEATRFATWITEDESFTLNVRLVPNDFGDRARAGVTLRLVPAVLEVDSWQPPPAAAPLRLRRVRPDRRVVRRYAPVEFALDLSASYDNPFDPDQIAVEATFELPGGREECVPGFYWEGFRAEYEGGEELLSRAGAAGWKVRYTPREVGAYSVTVRARDTSGEVECGPVTFRCVESDAPGFVRVGEAHEGGPRYLRLDGGETLFLIGHNITTYPANLDEVFRRMAAGGENYTRFWMWSDALGIEWGMPPGYYRMHEAWRLDRVLELARRHGIYVMLCLDTHQDFQDKWAANPYNAARGGPCRQVMDFFRSEEARAAYRRRLRYVVARWGHHPNLLCWEFANEIEGYPGAAEHKAEVAQWHAEMARFVAGLDAFDHPITTSQWTTDGWPELWHLPEMAIVQSHRYANDPGADMAAEVAAVCAQKLSEYPGKPHVFGEYGVDSHGGAARVDPAGVHLHNGNWAALMSGAASNPVSWWHSSYIHPLDLYGVYRGLARFVAGEALAQRRWQPLAVESVGYVRSPEIEYSDLEFAGEQTGWDAPLPDGTRFVVRRDGVVEGLARLPCVLHGRGHADLGSPFAFDLDCLAPARFAVHVDTVSAGAVLVFNLDGRTVRTVELPAGEGLGKGSEWQERWGIWQTRYDEAFGIDVPVGRHTVEIENTGQDWIKVAQVRLEGYVTNERPRLRVLGLVARDRALLWVQNTEHTWFNVREGRRIAPVAPTRLCLGGVAGGRWTVECWDTRTGRMTRRSRVLAAGGRVELELPRIERDVALKLIREGPP